MDVMEEQTVITQDVIDNAFTYKEYVDYVDKLYEEGTTTSGHDSEAMLHYTQLNQHRMKRLERTAKLDEKLVDYLQNLDTPMIWLVITEGWCGDAAQNLPLLHKMEEASDKVEMRLILRDQNLEIMDQYLTNGGRSIPKLIALKKDTLEELGTWGPRPAPAQELFLKAKNDDSVNKQEIAKDIQKWYAKDRSRTLQMEMLENLVRWNSDK